jgi:signal transduction histidine kinase
MKEIGNNYVVKEHNKTGSLQRASGLAKFIHENTEQIVTEWETFARTLKPAANDMTPLALRNHIHEILNFIINDIQSPQSNAEQVQKSQGGKERSDTPTAAETHAALRLAGGFDIEQMVSEWRALRASVIKLWSLANKDMSNEDVLELTRFNEAIDQELVESVSHYTHKVSYSKDLFIGILSHDLRSPLNVISLSTQLILTTNASPERQRTLVKQIFESTSRVVKIVDDLVDMTRARFGSGLPVIPMPMDMGLVSGLLVEEMRSAHPLRTINSDISGDLKGKWDKARIGQVLSNLIGNAVQYSSKDSAISVTVKGNEKDVILSVHNEGVPIPPEKIGNLFDALTRASIDTGSHSESVNLGLGLFIAKEIIVSHGGKIDVISTKDKGTTFTAQLPRFV